MNVTSDIAAGQEEIQSLRRRMHSNPELGFEETQTADLIAETLASWGIEVHRGIGRTGVVGVLRAGNGTRSIGLRADMDALPMQEANTFAHHSQNGGKMHACGHDGHVAMLLGAARHLARARDFDGTIVFIFQPAEELGEGAKAMIDDGLFEKFPVDAVFALHNLPGLPAGMFSVRPGAIYSSASGFRIRIIGVGAHAATPHMGKDPVFTAVQIYNALQGIITRAKRPADTAVISVTRFHAGEAGNAIPESATIAGTVRVLDIATQELIESQLRTISECIAAAHDCQVEFTFVHHCPAVINTPNEARFAAEVMKSIVGETNVDASVDKDLSLGAEDFAFMLLERPGAYAGLGNGNGEHRELGHAQGPCLLHNASYDFNDGILELGSRYWVELSRKWLAKSGTYE
ncbi:M20 aminoacylase family protein [Bradyrhizobium yuanmingense]|uniref:M20 aminoacylase family protein n=1 Tax=Bradyrhizobium yuanmingense TaxID=108015 RepID=UPI0023B93C23|nr:M20 aminoacylase family protein [Bradyrhizobium yuanmingense]MDF0581972.1 M20 family metallopeptidase [Bradyrhizobium yuanmingense]